MKTFRAATVQEALALVRQALGPDAVILDTQEVASNRLLRWLPGMRQVEVTASREAQGSSTSASSPRPIAPPPRRGNEQLAELSRRASQRPEVAQSPPPPKPIVPPTISRFQTPKISTPPPALKEPPPALQAVYQALLEREFPPEIARGLVEKLEREAPKKVQRDLDTALERVRRFVVEELKTTGPMRLTPGKCRVAALVGPTGVGKTTTVAKLAAHFRLVEQRKVGLVTVDTYRIAAVEQLRTYADVIDLPMRVAGTPAEMRDALREFSDMDLVLVDTAGRSPRDELKLRELQTFLAEARPDEVHLTLSASSSPAQWRHTAERFRLVGPTSVALTKIDEALDLSGVLPLLRACGLPFSYLATGQSVPDDFEPAGPERLVDWMMDPSSLAGG